MNRKWMPITAGVLDILHGIFGIILGLMVMVLSNLLGPITHFDEILGPLLLIMGILSIIGGIYSIKRTTWRIALVGVITSILPSTLYMEQYWQEFSLRHTFYISDLLVFTLALPAVFAIVLTVLSRKQFNKNSE
jgi:hypothetical protein